MNLEPRNFFQFLPVRRSARAARLFHFFRLRATCVLLLPEQGALLPTLDRGLEYDRDRDDDLHDYSRLLPVSGGTIRRTGLSSQRILAVLEPFCKFRLGNSLNDTFMSKRRTDLYPIQQWIDGSRKIPLRPSIILCVPCVHCLSVNPRAIVRHKYLLGV